MATNEKVAQNEADLAAVADIIRHKHCVTMDDAFLEADMPPMEFYGIMDVLVRAGLVLRHNGMLTWVEPKGN